MPKKNALIQELPITISLKVAGQDQVIKTDNILTSLRSLDTDPLKIKSRATFEISYNGEIHRKIFKVIQYRRLLASDDSRRIYAKQFNQALGLPI